MIALFIYGCGLLYLISHILNYSVSFLEIIVMSIVSFVVDITFLRNKKSIMITLLVLCILGGGGVLGFLISGNQQWLYETVLRFIRPYYKVINGENIDLVGQLVLLFIVIIAIYRLLISYNGKKYIYYLFNGSALIIVIAGFSTGYLSAVKDRASIMIFIGSSLIYYFYNYYISRNDTLLMQEINGEGKREAGGFRPFFIIGIIVVIGTLSGASLLNIIKPFPFYKEDIAYIVSDEEEDGKGGLSAYYKILEKEGNIDDEFVFDGVELFRVKAEGTNYLRGIVYESYSNNKWKQSKIENYMASDFGEKAAIDLYSSSEMIDVKYTGVNTPVILTSPYARRVQMRNEDILIRKDLRRNTYYIDKYYNNSNLKVIAYSFESFLIDERDSQFKDWLMEKDIARASLDGTLYEMPDGYEEIEELTLEITAGLSSDYEKIQAIIEYLGENCTYNTTPEIVNNQDKINFFLFESKEGFCQHFATSATLMLRSIGIPARYVYGYRIDLDVILGQDEEFIPVYDANAHTWVEVYIPDFGWMMIEATPSEINQAVGQDGDLKNEGTIKDNETTDHNLGMVNYKVIGYFGIIFIVFIVIGSGVVAYKIIKDKKAYEMSQPTDKTKVIYHLILEYFKAGEVQKASHESPREYATRIDKLELIHGEKRFMDIIDDYERIIYDDQTVTEDVLRGFEEYLRQVKQAMNTSMGNINRIRLEILIFVNT